MSCANIWAAMAVIGSPARARHDTMVDVEYRPEDGVVRAYNRTPTDLRIYYGDIRQHRTNGMIYVRFRGRNKDILDIGLEGGWFTLALYVSQLYPELRREELTIPAASFVDVQWDLVRQARSVNFDSRGIGPCEAQVGVLGYLDDRESRTIEATTEWMPSPCPGRQD